MLVTTALVLRSDGRFLVGMALALAALFIVALLIWRSMTGTERTSAPTQRSDSATGVWSGAVGLGARPGAGGISAMLPDGVQPPQAVASGDPFITRTGVVLSPIPRPERLVRLQDLVTEPAPRPLPPLRPADLVALR